MYDLIIIGGGVSGLYLYYRLIHSGMKILLLEKENRLGGRIYEYSDKNITLQRGASRFNENHERVIRLLKEFNLIDFRKDKGKIPDTVFINKGDTSLKKFKGKTGFYYINKILKKVETQNLLSSDTLMKHSFYSFCF